MNRRERVLLIVAATLVGIVGWYFYLYAPRQAEYSRLSQELAGREAERTRMEAAARQITRLEQEYRESQSFIAAIEAKLPSEKEIPSLMVQLERLTTSLGIDLRFIRPSPLQSVTPTASQPSSAKPATGQPAAGQPAATAAPPYFRFPIKIGIVATYAELLRITNSIQTFPRLMVVRKFIMTPAQQLPELRSEMDVETYVLPKEGR